MFATMDNRENELITLRENSQVVNTEVKMTLNSPPKQEKTVDE